MLSGCNDSQKNNTPIISKPGQHTAKLNRQITLNMDYLLYLPEEYGKEKKLWPVMLFLHGTGERGSNLNKVKTHGPPKLIAEGKKFPFIVVSPQCPLGNYWPNMTETVMALIDEIIEKYDVDESRIYMTGLSMGGYGTWTIACTFPDRFAAIAPICGAGQPILAYKLKLTPVWAFHGDEDPTVDPEESRKMVDRVNEADGNAKLTMYKTVAHDSWTKTYENDELYDWFLQHQNMVHPENG